MHFKPQNAIAIGLEFQKRDHQFVSVHCLTLNSLKDYCLDTSLSCNFL